jgi:hypothetical protein
MTSVQARIYDTGQKPLCPSLSQGTVSEKYTFTPIGSPYPIVTCTYSPDTVTPDLTDEDIDIWENTFITGRNAVDYQEANTTLNEQILPVFCSGITTSCRPDPLTDTTPETCSRLIDISNLTCPLWSVTHTTQTDSIMNSYCDTFPSAYECECINRNLNPVYNALGTGLNESQDHCWFIPCSNKDIYLIPSTKPEGPCPDVCGVVIRNYDNSDISFEDADIYVNCEGFEENNGGGGGGSPTGHNDVPAVGGLSWAAWVGIAVGIVIFVVLLVLIIVLVKKNKQTLKVSTPTQ